MVQQYMVATITAVVFVFFGALILGPEGDGISSSTSSSDQALEDFVASQQPEQEFTTEPTDDRGSFLPYSAELVAANAEEGAVLFFNAAWCPTCQIAKKNFSENANSLPDGLHILDLDFDDNQDLRVRYGVTVQHTFVQVDENGELIKKWTGSFIVDQLVGQLEA